MANIIGIVLGLLKAVPILDRWFKNLYAAYAEQKVKQQDADFIEAMRALVADHDQRKLEELIGNNSGKPDPDQRDIITGPIKK